MNPLLQALGFAGDVLDTPGSVARGLLTGNVGRAFGGILDPSQRVYGSEVTGDPYSGFAFDVATDPLNLIGGLGLLKTARAAKAAKASNAAREAILADMASVGTKGKNAAGLPYEAIVPDSEIANAMRGHYQAAEAAEQAAIRPAMESFTAPSASLRQTPGVLGPGVSPQFSLPSPGQIMPKQAPFSDLSDPAWVKEAMYWMGDHNAGIPDTITSMFRPSVARSIPDFTQVPSMNPLLALLGGQNAARTGAYL